jgi:hypothetical protein
MYMFVGIWGVGLKSVFKNTINKFNNLVKCLKQYINFQDKIQLKFKKSKKPYKWRVKNKYIGFNGVKRL